MQSRLNIELNKKKKKTGVFCRNCNSVHKKCSRLKQAELLGLKRNRVSFLWESSTCMKDRFPCHSADNMDIVGPLTQTSHINAKKTTNFVLEFEQYISNYKVDSEKTDKPYSRKLTNITIVALIKVI